MPPKLVSGARVLCYVNGRLLAGVSSFVWTSSSPRKKIRVVDLPIPVELAATTVDVTWQMTTFRQIGDGGAQGPGIVAANLTDIVREKYFSLLLIERATQLPLFQADYCNLDSENWSINAKMIMTGQLSGSGIVWVNEAAQ